MEDATNKEEVVTNQEEITTTGEENTQEEITTIGGEEVMPIEKQEVVAYDETNNFKMNNTSYILLGVIIALVIFIAFLIYKLSKTNNN